MKIIFGILIFLSLLKADEMSRIEAIVKDITELRQKYDECQKELSSKQNTKTIAPKQQSNAELYEKIAKLEKEIVLKDKLLKSKDKIINNLQKSDDKFPKLMMKEQNNPNDEKIIRFKAAAFRLKYESIIYDGINGKNIDKWEKHRSFTSSIKTKSWIKVTGYFVNKKWTPAKKEMWIKIKQVEKK
jgi:predicted RND superfamily exporter protein